MVEIDCKDVRRLMESSNMNSKIELSTQFVEFLIKQLFSFTVQVNRLRRFGNGTFFYQVNFKNEDELRLFKLLAQVN